MFNPVATYRLQFHTGFTFSAFENMLPYLHRLGVHTIYASPIFKSVPGSTHGYDGLDPHQVNPEIGTRTQLLALSEQLHQKGMYWLQDIVPNHMAFHPANKWLMDVLEKGKRSAYAGYFDIDWNSPVYQGRVMVPFLGAPLEEVIQNKELKIGYNAQRLTLTYYDSSYPVQPATYAFISNLNHAPVAVSKLARELPDPENEAELYSREWEKWLKRFSSLFEDTTLKAWLENTLQQVNSDPVLLQQVAHSQHYRLCHWQETDHTINYRRFFTVNGLICLNIQDENVFQDYHARITELVAAGVFQGIRIDHIDGLYDPSAYLRRLRAATGRQTYIIAEKILEADEKLPPNWPIQGTSGYEFLAVVNNLFTNNESEPAFDNFYASLINNPAPVEQQVFTKKAYILYEHMAGELDNLYRLLESSGLIEPEKIDAIDPGLVKKAIGEFLVHCPVYRYYGNNMPLAEAEQQELKNIFDSINNANHDLADAVQILESAWLKKPREGDTEYNSRAAHFYKRCMQFSGPAMAKGVEDTLMYTYNRFIGHNEVGDAPGAFGFKSLDTFHEKMKERQQLWPIALNATATHDTKRGEDARARLNVLSDLPGEWMAAVKEWQQQNQSLKKEGAPGANDEYFIYQTLIGSYPMPGDPEDGYANRLQEYLQKALREAKQHSNWTTPNEAYESAAKSFAVALLDKQAPFWKSFAALHQKVAEFGIINSLAQVLLKFTCPGVPDTYQGCELWDFSFVDPDNRRPVDFVRLNELLVSIEQTQKTENFLNDLWQNRFDGQIKLWLVHQLLQLRKQESDLFTSGDYIPLKVTGKYQDHLLAFGRKGRRHWITVVVPLHLAALCKEQDQVVEKLNWKGTTIVLPDDVEGGYQNILTGNGNNVFKEKIPVQELFGPLPFAVLKLQRKENPRGAGVLAHITSLPSGFGIGDLGPEAYKFADFLYQADQKYWQLLPVNPVEAGQGYSPYSTTSSRAGNTWLLSPEILAEEGLIDKDLLSKYRIPATSAVDFAAAEKLRTALFEIAWQQFKNRDNPETNQAFPGFCEKEREWLHDFAMYTLLKEAHQGKPWYEWKEDFKQREPGSLKSFEAENKEGLRKIKWLQFQFEKQWLALKNYCHKRNIQLIGDLPFYVSYDSADVWSHREIFALDQNGERTGIAGVPPDAFSADGQLWGMPVFKWDVLKSRGYDWWIGRLRKNKELFDLIRLDHFRAFSAYWEVPAKETTARNGKWLPGPGADFFEALHQALGDLPFLAEDLGEIDQPVYKLRDRYEFPGMKVLQFAYGDDMPNSTHAPHNYLPNFFAYTGTHDNNTTRGWYRRELSSLTRKKLEAYTGMELTEENVAGVLSRMMYASVANTVILPIQDVLNLDETARMNTPSVGNGSWLWRMLPDQITEDDELQLKEWVYLYNRQ